MRLGVVKTRSFIGFQANCRNSHAGRSYEAVQESQQSPFILLLSVDRSA